MKASAPAALVVLFVLFLGIFTVACDDSEDTSLTVEFAPGTRTPAPKQVFLDLQGTEGSLAALAVRVRGTTGIYSADLTLTYDPTRLAFRDHERGVLLESGGGTVDYDVREDVAGTLRIEITRTTAGTVSAGTDDPRLVTLGFEVLSKGSAPLSFSLSSLADEADVPIPGLTFHAGILTAS